MTVDMWRDVFCRYIKDPRLLSKFVEYVESVGVEKALREASRYIVVKGFVPNGLTLGFSPQIIVAVASARLVNDLDPKLHIITSPEVAEGSVDAAEHSNKMLTLFREQGLVKSLRVVRMSPSLERGVDEVLNEMTNAFREALSEGLEVLDISGGTQLVPIAAMRAGIRRMSYTYPDGSHMVIHSFEV